MGLFWNILFWGAIIWMWTHQGKEKMRREQDARRRNAGYLRDVILEGFGKMLGFISKADGHISEPEVNVASKCLRSLGLSEDEYQICVRAFNSVRAYSFSAFSACASRFASIVTGEARTLVYEMLWIVAAADGVLDVKEDELLSQAVGSLDIDPTLYLYFKRMYFGVGGGSAGGFRNNDSDLDKAYARLGCTPSDTDEAVRSAYRKLAMRYHPDRLKAEGVPEGMIAQATRSMAEINAAWDVVRKERHL